MNPGYVKFLRWLTIIVALGMMAVSGHYWNVEKVPAPLLICFDMMLLLLSICVLAMIMWDADEKGQNLRAVFFLIAGVLSMLFVFS